MNIKENFKIWLISISRKIFCQFSKLPDYQCNMGDDWTHIQTFIEIIIYWWWWWSLYFVKPMGEIDQNCHVIHPIDMDMVIWARVGLAEIGGTFTSRLYCIRFRDQYFNYDIHIKAVGRVCTQSPATCHITWRTAPYNQSDLRERNQERKETWNCSQRRILVTIE